MIEIGKQLGKEKVKNEEGPISNNTSNSLLLVENDRKFSVEEMFTEKGFCFGKSYLRPTPASKVYWDLENKKTLNYSALFVGGSGSGKTRMAVNAIKYLGEIGKDVIVMDVQGDMGLEPHQETVYKLTRRNNDVGFNFFTFSKDSENGGPIANANLIIELFKNSVMENGIGPFQKAVLKQVIIDCYRAKGILDEDESTWDNELPTPKFFDVFTQMILGTTSGSKMMMISEIIQELANLKNNHDKSDEDKKAKIQEKIQATIERLRAFSTKIEEYVVSDMHKGLFEGIALEEGAVDLSFYYNATNFKVLGTLQTYIKTMADCPLFGDKPFPKIKGVVRFDISSYTTYGKPEEAIFFINFVFAMFFRTIKERGEYRYMPEEHKITHGRYCDKFLFIDESKLILPTGKNKENPYHLINRIVTEGRKYGGGMGIISQRLEHFSGELINSIFTKVLLQTERSDTEKAIKLLGIKNKHGGAPEDLFNYQRNSIDGIAVVGTTGGLYDAIVTPWYKATERNSNKSTTQD